MKEQPLCIFGPLGVKHAKEKHQFIPLSYASPANSVIDYFSNKDYNMNTYIDYSGSIFSTFNVSATPTIVIMDKNNKILFNGYKSKRFYKKLLNKLHS